MVMNTHYLFRNVIRQRMTDDEVEERMKRKVKEDGRTKKMRGHDHESKRDMKRKMPNGERIQRIGENLKSAREEHHNFNQEKHDYC